MDFFRPRPRCINHAPTAGLIKGIQKTLMQFRSQLARDRFEKYVLEVVSATLEKGGTVSNVDTCQLLAPTDDWKFPKYP